MSEYDSIVTHIERHPGVLGAMVIGMEDGMVIAGTEALGASWEPAAALASSLFRSTREAAANAGLGEASFVRLEADRGNVCATARGDIVLVAVTSQNINFGRLRLEMLSVTEGL